MKRLTTLGAVTAFALAGCGSQAEAEKEKAAAPMTEMAGMEGSAAPAATPAATETTYTASGTIESVSGNTVTIAHGPVEALGWPAMTMGFEAADPATVQSVKAGDKVTFSFRQAAGKYELTAITPAS